MWTKTFFTFREQGFSTEQTLAFRGIARDIFEAGIVKGELNLEEAFQAFTKRVLSLAVVPEEAESDDNNTAAARSTPPGGFQADLEGSCSPQDRQCSSTVAASVGENRKRSAESGPGRDELATMEPSSEVGRHQAERAPVFSVADVRSITQFVARGLYRNFSLYRMCFEHDTKVCTEVRHVKVETPLSPPRLTEAEPC